MDFVDPLGAVVPGAQGQVLRALLGAGRELSTSDVARVADVSQPQASRVLARLVVLGLVERREVPPAALHRPAHGNAVVRLLDSIRTVRESVIREMRRTSRRIEPAPTELIVFGSFARGQAREGSDIDVLAVRPPDADAERFADAIGAWAEHIERFAGSAVNPIVVSEAEWAVATGASEGLLASARTDGIAVLERSGASA